MAATRGVLACCTGGSSRAQGEFACSAFETTAWQQQQKQQQRDVATGGLREAAEVLNVKDVVSEYLCDQQRVRNPENEEVVNNNRNLDRRFAQNTRPIVVLCIHNHHTDTHKPFFTSAPTLVVPTHNAAQELQQQSGLVAFASQQMLAGVTNTSTPSAACSSIPTCLLLHTQQQACSVSSLVAGGSRGRANTWQQRASGALTRGGVVTGSAELNCLDVDAATV